MKNIIAVLFVFAAAGCLSGSGKKQEEPVTPLPVAAPATNSNSAAPSVSQPTTAQPQPAAPPVSTSAVNPAHGQPGHRCDIPVGSPLNSKPGQVAQPQATTTPIPLTTPVATQPVSAPQTATGLNPAHGQPGHRCDIAVGAPLNSKPAQ